MKEEMMKLLKKRAAEKDGMLSEEQKSVKLSVLDELKDLVHELMAKDLPMKQKGGLAAHVEAENPEELKKGLSEAIKVAEELPGADADKEEPEDMDDLAMDDEEESEVEDEEEDDKKKKKLV